MRSQAKRSDSITSWNSITRDAALANLFVASPAVGNTAALPNDSTASVPASTTSATEVKTPSTLVSSVIFDRNWESDMESLLKVRYTLISYQLNFMVLAGYVQCHQESASSTTTRCTIVNLIINSYWPVDA